MRIMLLGFELESSNKGCEALSYSIMSVLNSLKSFQPLEVVVINIHDSMGDFPKIYSDVKFTNIRMRVKRIEFWKRLKKELKDCTAVIDITHGDSFTDIYGKNWFATTTLVKTFIVNSKTPLILMPQTYGPFNTQWAVLWAKYVIKKADRIYTRDTLSYDYLKSLGIMKDVVNTLDLAFSLPYKKEDKVEETINIGINISGLLWDDCEKENRFGLKTNYCNYCRELINQLSQNPNFTIALVPHVLCDNREGEEFFENDSRAIRELMKEFPKCKFPNNFRTALDIKNYIVNLDILVAARMHASIAAYSAGVPVIPFSYSRKFEGVYEDLKYSYVVNGLKLSTQEALVATLEYIDNREQLAKNEIPGRNKLQALQSEFVKDFASTLELLRKK